jgi:polyisoprenyl-teichoic acid--peptidoglycan teichoic acid transferase
MAWGSRIGGSTVKKIAVLVVCLVIAALCTVMLLDPWGWLNEGEDAAAGPGTFPGVVEPPLLAPAEPVSSAPYNVLILGLDHGLGRPEEGNNRSDVIMIAHIDEARQRACLLSIPRDSWVDIPGYHTAKINEAYEAGGAQLAMQTVKQLTGMNFRNYLVLDFDEFRRLVDLFGGVQVTMNEALNDPKVGYIPAGNQVLNGDQALVLARSRNYSNGDLERVRQQQKIIIQILYKGKELADYPGAAWFLSIALQSLETNLNADEVIRLAREFATFPAVDVQGGVAPGKMSMVSGASVILLDTAKLQELVYSIQGSCTVPQEFR